LELFSPEYALEEINDHSKELMKKAGLSRKRFAELRRELARMVEFVPVEDYRDMLKSALDICPDSGDIDFFALALRLRAPLWSNDRLLKRQKRVVVVCTLELIEMPEFFESCL
jgi:predicted nucleic acid-binding protein